MSHDTVDRPQRDMRRDAWLTAQGITVMRIAASEVVRGFDGAALMVLSTRLIWTTTAIIDAAPLHRAFARSPFPASRVRSALSS